jgi:hypothetical protein
VLNVPRLGLAPEQLRRLREGGLAARRWLRDYKIGGHGPAALERVISRCRKEGIGVILVAPPLAAAHRVEYLPPIEAAFRAHVERLARGHGCHFVDARDWLPDHLFRDASHIDIPEGTLAFSGMLTRRVLVGLLAGDGRARAAAGR